MNILAVSCFTGDSDLCQMTEDMMLGLEASLERSDADWRIHVVAQGAERHDILGERGTPVTAWEKNIGFSAGMNFAIARGMSWGFEPDYVLCLNNDLQFPSWDWIAELLKEASPNHITVPATDITACHPMPRSHSGKPAFFANDMSAYAWLVPFKWCQWLKKTHGFWLFSEDFAPAYGEDNWTTLLLRQQFGDSLFRVVPAAWIKHLKAKTASVVKPDRRKTSRVLVSKCREFLKQGNLSRSLRQKAETYVKVLKC